MANSTTQFEPFDQVTSDQGGGAGLTIGNSTIGDHQLRTLSADATSGLLHTENALTISTELDVNRLTTVTTTADTDLIPIYNGTATRNQTKANFLQDQGLQQAYDRGNTIDLSTNGNVTLSGSSVDTVIENTGFVGIGVANPTVHLDILGRVEVQNALGTLLFLDQDGNNRAVDIDAQTTTSRILSSIGRAPYTGTSTSSAHLFLLDDAGSTGTNIHSRHDGTGINLELVNGDISLSVSNTLATASKAAEIIFSPNSATDVSGLEIAATNAGAGSAAAINITAGSIVQDEVTIASSAVSNLNLNESNLHRVTLDADVTLTFTQPLNDYSGQIFLTQDGTGGRSVTWPTITWLTDNGNPPRIDYTSNSVTVVNIFWNGLTYTGWSVGNSRTNKKMIQQEGSLTAGASATALRESGTLIGTNETDVTSSTNMDDHGLYFKQGTAATLDDIAFVRGPNNQFRISHNLDLVFKFRLVDTTDIRWFCGLGRGNQTNLTDNDALTRDHVALGYSTAAGDTDFMFISGNTAQTRTSTGIPIDTNVHFFSLESNSDLGGWVMRLHDDEFNIQAEQVVTGAQVPGIADNMRLLYASRALAAVVKEHDFYFANIAVRGAA